MQNPVKKWEVTFLELESKTGKKYKVSRHFHELRVSETKVFKSKTKAKQQLQKWLNL